MITEYLVIYSTSLVQLTQEVRVMIKHGWTPTGGIACDCNTKGYLQAMVK